MFYIVDKTKIYNEVDGRAVPVNVSATRNEFTGVVTSYSVEAAGEAVEIPETQDVATINEVIARFGCAFTPYKFPAGKAAESTEETAAKPVRRTRKKTTAEE